MSSPTNGALFEARVMVEVLKDGVPRRVHVWLSEGSVFASFPPDMTEAEAVQLVAVGTGLVGRVDMRSLFQEPGGKRRRWIETE